MSRGDRYRGTSTRDMLRKMTREGLENLIADETGRTSSTLLRYALEERRRRDPLEVRTARRRPWRVFVRSIGPSFSFRTEERAHARARQLTEPGGVDTYAEVLVYPIGLPGEPFPMFRTVYRFDAEPRLEILERGSSGWKIHTPQEET